MESEVQGAGFLETVLAETRRRVAVAVQGRADWERRAASAPEPPHFAAALRAEDVRVVAEVKRRSPSGGEIRPGADVESLAAAYAEAGAAAISVLTESMYFDGSLEDVRRIATAVRLPVLRKDFIIHPVQLFEARAVGAAAVLLIGRLLPARLLEELCALAHSIGLGTLVEIHTAGELRPAIAARPSAIGVNARDLDTLRVDAGMVPALLGLVPPDVLAVAESGLASRDDVARVAAAGADAVLVGTALAGAPDPGAALRSLVGVRRGPARSGSW